MNNLRSVWRRNEKPFSKLERFGYYDGVQHEKICKVFNQHKFLREANLLHREFSKEEERFFNVR